MEIKKSMITTIQGWLSFTLFFIVTTINAGIPLWTFTPLTPTTLNLFSGEMATVQYQVTNQSHRIHQLVMTPISGITASGTCSLPFGYKQTCLLTLTIDSHSVNNPTIGGPALCQQGNPLQCYRPGPADNLQVTIGEPLFTIGGTISGLTANGLVLQNNGSDNLSINANAKAFQFMRPVPLNGSFNVTVLANPTGLNMSSC